MRRRRLRLSRCCTCCCVCACCMCCWPCLCEAHARSEGRAAAGPLPLVLAAALLPMRACNDSAITGGGLRAGAQQQQCDPFMQEASSLRRGRSHCARSGSGSSSPSLYLGTQPLLAVTSSSRPATRHGMLSDDRGRSPAAVGASLRLRLRPGGCAPKAKRTPRRGHARERRWRTARVAGVRGPVRAVPCGGECVRPRADSFFAVPSPACDLR